MKYLREALRLSLLLLAAATPAAAAVTKTELAGNDLASYPYFEYVHAINDGSPVHVAIDPSRFPAIVNQTCDIYVVAAKKTAGWLADNTLTDITLGGKMTQTFTGASIQANTFQVAGPFELSAAAGTGLGVGYDVILDCNQNALLDGNDYIDNPNNEAGFYMVHDTTAPGPFTVTEPPVYAVPNGAAFGIVANRLMENVFFPTNIAALQKLPLVVISHGNGHNYQWYDHIGKHLASYGYIVMSHQNDTGPGPFTASTTTLAHTDAFIAAVAAGTLPGGAALTGHLDKTKIVWIGHSRGAEGVAVAYDRLFDNTYTPQGYARNHIKLISSMLPTDFLGTAQANPHDANYHLWTASGDDDVDGWAGSSDLQTFHLHDRAVGHRQSTVVQGTGHGWFHNDPDPNSDPYFTGPCAIGQADTHAIELGHFLPLIKRYVEDNIPSIDFLTRQYESFRPIGAPNGVCDVVTHEYYDASLNGTLVLDDYQTNTGTGLSSSGGAVSFDVTNLSEGLLDDNNSDFTWMASDPFNGATQGATGGVYSDSSRGVVFDWSGADRFYEWAVPAADKDFTSHLWLSFRGAQGTRHPHTLATAGDLTFTVTLRDVGGNSSSINIGAYGGGIETPYLRSGGWHNEMETIRIRLTDFLNDYSLLNLSQVAAVRLDVGPAWGSPQGRLVIDDLVLSNDRAVYDGADNGDPHINTVSGENYDFHSAGEFTLLRDDDEVEIQVRQTPVSSAPPIYNAHTQLASCVSVNTALAVRVAGRRLTYQPSLRGTANPEGMELRVDGELIDIDQVLVLPLGPDAQVAKTSVGNGIRIDFPDGGWLKAIPGWWGSQSTWYLNLSVRNTPASEGLMGFVPSGSWLPRLPDGSSMGPRPLAESQRFSDLNVKFADAWRVSKRTSLFDYASGMSTLDFTDKSYPPPGGERCDIPGHPPIEPIALELAAQLCRPIVKKNQRDNCTFDVMQTGDRGFARTYLLFQQLEQRDGEAPPPRK